MSASTPDRSENDTAYRLLTEHGFGIATIVVLIGVCTAFGVPSELWNVLPGSRAWWAILGAVLTALAYGPYALASGLHRADGQERALRRRAVEATLNGLVVLLATFVLLVGIGKSPAVSPRIALLVTVGSAIVGYLAVLTLMERRS